jgi:hypothetical protein
MELVSTSYAERQNLNIRMQNCRYTRLTNAFSKKAGMLAYSIAITFCYHNFVRVHQTLKTTPAVAAGIVARKWRIEDLVELADVPHFAGKQIQMDPLLEIRSQICRRASAWQSANPVRDRELRILDKIRYKNVAERSGLRYTEITIFLWLEICCPRVA